MAPAIEDITLSSLPHLLEHDSRVKVAGIDIDGILRGKIISKEKFLSAASTGFGYCSVIFGWDMHDQPYPAESNIKIKNNFGDILAVPDLSSYRRIPWENDVPFFLSFFDPHTRAPFLACPRGLLKTQLERIHVKDCRAMAGAEFEFYTFRTPKAAFAGSLPSFFERNPPHELPSLADGMFGYSLTQPARDQDWYHDVYDSCTKFKCDIEGWHSESGPGVYEAALAFDEASHMADRANLFKYAMKGVSTKYDITPCFMAKPKHGLPGNSGHIHVSIVDKDGGNLFARSSTDASAQWEDIANLSDLGRHFLAGLLEGLPDIMAVLAPTINSYKRLVENFWAPVTVSWGLEHRAASVRIIAPPTAKASATRFEVRVPGADANPHLVLAALLGCGWRGVEKKLAIPLPPLTVQGGTGDKGEGDSCQRLPRDLKAATERFLRQDSIAREVMGDSFVDHFGGTRNNEVRIFDEAVTDWEIKRYIETV